MHPAQLDVILSDISRNLRLLQIRINQAFSNFLGINYIILTLHYIGNSREMTTILSNPVEVCLIVPTALRCPALIRSDPEPPSTCGVAARIGMWFPPLSAARSAPLPCPVLPEKFALPQRPESRRCSAGENPLPVIISLIIGGLKQARGNYHSGYLELQELPVIIFISLISYSLGF